VNEIQTERNKKDSSFAIEERPLDSDQRSQFSGLNYYPISKDYVVDARIEVLNGEEIIKLKTSTDRLPDYRVYAYVYFQLNDTTHKLTAYQSIKLQTDSLYKDLLFLPFTDENSTVTTYGGGRYIDFTIPKTDTFKLDFNKAYNPYCAYNHKWSCVIPPRDNSLSIAINAGEKLYNTEH